MEVDACWLGLVKSSALEDLRSEQLKSAEEQKVKAEQADMELQDWRLKASPRPPLQPPSRPEVPQSHASSMG